MKSKEKGRNREPQIIDIVLVNNKSNMNASIAAAGQTCHLHLTGDCGRWIDISESFKNFAQSESKSGAIDSKPIADCCRLLLARIRTLFNFRKFIIKLSTYFVI